MLIENLNEQLNKAKGKNKGLEDQVSATQSSLEKERKKSKLLIKAGEEKRTQIEGHESTLEQKNNY